MEYQLGLSLLSSEVCLLVFWLKFLEVCFRPRLVLRSKVLGGLFSASVGFEVNLCVRCSRSRSCWDCDFDRSLCRPDDRDRSLLSGRLLHGVLDLGGDLVFGGVLVLVLDGVLCFDGDLILGGVLVLVLDGVLPLLWGRIESTIFPFAILGSIMVVMMWIFTTVFPRSSRKGALGLWILYWSKGSTALDHVTTLLSGS